MSVVVGLVVLLILGGAVWGFVSNVVGSPGPSGPVQVDTPITGDVPSRGTWATALTIVDAGVYWLTATAEEDLTMALYDMDSTIAENDDGSSSVLSGGSLDPALVLYLEPGEYVVAVETYGSESADAELRVNAVIDAVEVGIDVQARNGATDLKIDAWFAGESDQNDDRASGDPTGGEHDPYLGIDQPDGRVVFVVSPWGGSGADVEATVTVNAT